MLGGMVMRLAGGHTFSRYEVVFQLRYLVMSDFGVAMQGAQLEVEHELRLNRSVHVIL